MAANSDGGSFGSFSTQTQQISDLQQAVKNIEAKLSANSVQSDNNGEKDTQISDENDCESRLSDVSSDENFSDNEPDENGGKTVSFSFKDLVKGDEPSGSGENSNVEKLNKLLSDFEAKEVYGPKVHDNLANVVNLGMKASFFPIQLQRI